VSLLLDNGADIEAKDGVRAFIDTTTALSAVLNFINEVDGFV
jgi:hypothetical protein